MLNAMAPEFKKQFRLYYSCDASDVGVGSMLSQLNDAGVEHPVSYFSRKLDEAQRNYMLLGPIYIYIEREREREGSSFLSLSSETL